MFVFSHDLLNNSSMKMTVNIYLYFDITAASAAKIKYICSYCTQGEERYVWKV